MERRINFVKGEYYHIYNRSVEKRPIFLDNNDWKRFQNLLYLCNSQKSLVLKTIQGSPLDWDRGAPITSVLAYVLMPNHFHLIVKEETESGLTKFMSKVSTSFSMYFNTKYERSGSLLMHPFRAKHIDSNEYFRWVFSYVHLNPYRKESASPSLQGLGSYAFSSYADYFSSERDEGRIVAKNELPVDVSDLESHEQMLQVMRAFQGLPLE